MPPADSTSPAPIPAPTGSPAATRGLLVLALLLSFGAALSAGQVDPPANDYLLHGMIIERASTALTEEGWVTFADPWFPELNGGAALFRQYPHLPHQVVAFVAGTLGLDPWSTFSASVFLGVFLLPLAFFLGGRMLGLSPAASATAAFVAACLRCIDPFGHHLLSYGLAGKGLYAQLWGMNLAALALPAWIAAARGRSGGLAAWAPWARTACAALLVSATLRSSLPAGWLLCLCSMATVLFAGPRSRLTTRLLRFAGVGLGAGVLSLGFLLPFFADLPTGARSALEMQPALAHSVGAVAILKALASGDYFDGGSPGPWTLLLVLALFAPLLLHRSPQGGVSPPLRGLSAAGLLSLLLLFGRATWGEWVDTIPVVGRFHDHRYLLGLQLVAPWLISGSLVALAGLLVRRVRTRILWGLGGLTAVIATTPVVTDLRDEQSLAISIHVEFGANRGLLDALVAETEQDLPHRVALARPDAIIGGTSWLSWLRREGALTLGRPLHHYHHVHDFALWWSRWVSAEGGDRGRPVHPEDLAAAGVQRLLDPRLGSGTVEGPGPILVRSDLLVEAATPRLDGLGIRWFREGLHLGRQYPTVTFPGNSAPPGIEYLRTTLLEDHDLDSLQGLPQVSAALGQVLGVREPRPGRIEVDVDVTNEDAWLLLPQAWHRRWRVEVDGSLRASGMLLPGWMGVPLAKTDSIVTLTWPTSPVRATAAAANVILHGLLLWLLVTRRRVKLRCTPPPTQESPCAD